MELNLFVDVSRFDGGIMVGDKEDVSVLLGLPLELLGECCDFLFAGSAKQTSQEWLLNVLECYTDDTADVLKKFYDDLGVRVILTLFDGIFESVDRLDHFGNFLWDLERLSGVCCWLEMSLV